MDNQNSVPIEGGTAKDMNDALEEVLRLSQAMSEGRLDERATVDSYSGDAAELLVAVNTILDSLITPLRLASSSIRELAHGSIPPDFIVTEYKGEFDDIKRNLNAFLSVLYGMNHEMQHLIQSVKDGKLNTRGNDWDFEGCWKELIAGLNGTIDATVDPVLEARSVLEKLATCDLSVRMNGKYRGEHAQIKKTLNASLHNLHEAFSQVNGAVTQVADAASEITQSSTAVAQGALQQAQSLKEISSSMEQISIRTNQTADHAIKTNSLTKQAQSTAEDGKAAMAELLNAMNEIRAAAEGTQSIMQEINSITAQTDDLARNAAGEAARVGASARGFAVVADEVRKLAQRAKTIAQQVSAIQSTKTPGADCHDTAAHSDEKDVNAVVQELDNMALHTNYLALNAAVEAAYVDATGSGIEGITNRVQDLAAGSKASAAKTQDLLQKSMELSQNGQSLSNDVNEQLLGVVDAVVSVSDLIAEIAKVSQMQANELKSISDSISQLNQVTQMNAESAERSTLASNQLMQQTDTLAKSVSRFHLGA
ncbi:MAG: methyl-accepting chemotaxis protein [Calditrichota bacterium]